MLPDMSDTLDEWALPYLIKTVTQRTADFDNDDTIAGRTVEAVVQVAQKSKLNAADIDWSLRYLQIHSPSELFDGEFIEYQGEDYKIIDDGNYQPYGFSEVIAEQTKQTLLVVTP